MKLEIIEDNVGEEKKEQTETTLEGSIKFHNFESNRTRRKMLRKIKIYISMIKEIYDFYNGKRCRQETGDAELCGFMKYGC